MSDSIISRRYAGALYEQALSSVVLEEVDADITMIGESLEGAPELGRFFGSPIVAREKKTSVVRALFKDRIQQITLNFLLLMVDKGREQLFPDVVRAYQSLRDDQLGIVRVTARIARGVSEQQQRALVASIESTLGKKVRLDVQVEASLLGGIVVKIGDTVYDGSFKNQLKSLRKRLEEGVYDAGP